MDETRPPIRQLVRDCERSHARMKQGLSMLVCVQGPLWPVPKTISEIEERWKGRTVTWRRWRCPVRCSRISSITASGAGKRLFFLIIPPRLRMPGISTRPSARQAKPRLASLSMQATRILGLAMKNPTRTGNAAWLASGCAGALQDTEQIRKTRPG
jgi:hypothetical protein